MEKEISTSDACDGRCGRTQILCYLMDTGGDGGVYLCRDCWRSELVYRRIRNVDLGEKSQFDLPAWPGDEKAKMMPRRLLWGDEERK